ncbi:helicase DnaB [Mixta gaviniae]|uniref:DNA 5'-3' helicase n=1 Tax=Mixta gaviniae TaxID=665914 RepID=A0A2L0ILY0_9GAMM|nr:helicase DnaB [Mixta gaviniae]
MLDGGEERSQKVLAMLKPESFYNKAHGAIFEAVRDLLKRNQPVDLLTVSDELGRRGLLEQTGGFAYLAEISKGVPSVANIVHYAAAVRDCAMERYAISKLAEATEMLYTRSTMNAVEKLEAVSTLTSQISDYAKTGNRRGARALIDVMDDWLREVEGRFDNTGAHRGLSTGIPSLDAMLEPKGLVKGSLFVIGARPKMGKAMALDAKILLQDGTWTTHGEIKVGQKVASVDGSASLVTGVFPQGVRKMYQVTFEDGRTVKAADSHLWEISSSKFDGNRIVDTEKLEEMLQRVRYQGRLCIPSLSGDFGASADHVDGWVLGALLGDGSLTKSVKFTNSEDYVLSRMAASVAPLNLCHVGGNDYTITHHRGCKNPLLDKLREYGLVGRTAQEKEIPESIFSAEKETRIGVLIGLLETDGWVEKFGCIRFSSASKKLSQGVVKLVHSLGGTARETMRTDISYTYKGETLQGLDAQMVSMKLPDEILECIKSPRLRANLGINRLGNRGVGIKSVIEIEPEECLCIMVSHPRHLYVTDGYIVTHNTTLYSQMAINTAMREKLPAVLFSLEMPDKQIFERMVGQASGVNTDIFYRGSDNDTDFALANGHAMELVQSGNLFIDDTPGITLAHIVAESRRIKREKGAVGMVMVDYLTLMTGEKADRNDLSFGLITKGLKNLAKELGCVVVLLTQLNRDLEKRTNKRPLPSDSRDTGQIEQDCDYWLGIYREGAYDENYPQHETELLLRLNRHGKTGVVYAEQKNGAIYDADQLAYQAKAAEREAKPQKRGGF